MLIERAEHFFEREPKQCTCIGRVFVVLLLVLAAVVGAHLRVKLRSVKPLFASTPIHSRIDHTRPWQWVQW